MENCTWLELVKLGRVRDSKLRIHHLKYSMLKDLLQLCHVTFSRYDKYGKDKLTALSYNSLTKLTGDL